MKQATASLIRQLGALILAACAVGVWFVMAPDTLNHAADVRAISVEDEANNGLAEGAPQQTVVNGWTSNDYLALLSEQLDAQSQANFRDDRPTALLGLGVLGIALIAFTMGGGAPTSGTARTTPRVEAYESAG